MEFTQDAEVKAVIARYSCDECGVGEMRSTDENIAWLSDPIRFPCECDNCGNKQGLLKKYPVQEFIITPK